MSLKELLSEGKYVIYGAQVVAYGAYRAIGALYGRRPVCFVVSSMEGNPSEIEGVPVRTPEAIPQGALVLLAVTELLQGEILAGLQKRGIERVFPLTHHEEHLLMSAYYESIGLFPLLPDIQGSAPADLAIYEVWNERDKPLTNPPELFPYEHPIQAGAALTGRRAASLTDDTGENISCKNRQYCEMSATYWVWKNTSHAWKGIEHYRRHLLVRPEQLQDGIDAVLPLPYLCCPNTAAQFRRFVSEPVLQALLRALKELHPDRFEEYRSILYGQYQYTYNLVCARTEVFDAYCRWFFQITERMERMADEVPELGNTRALSYVAEVLTNLYFMSGGWNVRHVEKAIYT